MNSINRFEIIYNKYTMKVENIQKEVNNSHSFTHPHFSAIFVDYDLAQELPEDKREWIEDRLIKEIKKEHPNQNLIFIKEHHEITENYIKKKIKKAQKIGDKEDEQLGKRLQVLISKDNNPFDTYLNSFKRGFNEIFSIFENFNNDIINLLENFSKTEISEKRSIQYLIFFC